MSDSLVETVGPLDPAQIPSPLVAGSLGQAAKAANAGARAAAARRLARWLPPAAVERLGTYFDQSVVFEPETGWGQPRPFVLGDFIPDLSATPRAIQAAGAGNATQLELRTLEGPSDGADLGWRAEPDASWVVLAPARVVRGLAQGLSIGVRQFDRQFPAWSELIDDIATLSGADIFTKLFLAGGKESVTAWHRDGSDVVVTMLAGTKQFEVAPIGEPDGQDPHVEVSAVIRPGVALLLPRSRLHRATPTGSISALLSIGLMRHGDWAFRSAVPTHLSFDGFPQSPTAYRLMLRPHSPVRASGLQDASSPPVWRSRIPGGVIVLREGDWVEFGAQGLRFATSPAAFEALLAIHGSDGGLPGAAITDVAKVATREFEHAIDSLDDAGLLRRC
jgi:hypothetical protein